MLSDQQQRDLISLATMGCDRQTGCNYVGCTAGELLAALRQTPEFSAELLRAEATPEVMHMRCIHDSVKETKNWRASVWWLERRAPDRFARRPSAGLSPAEFQATIDELSGIIAEEIVDPPLRERVGRRLQRVAAELTHAFDLPGDAATSDTNLADAATDAELQSVDPFSEASPWQT